MGIKGNKNGIMYHLDEVSAEGNMLVISGFAICVNAAPVQFSVRSTDGTALPETAFSLRKLERPDISRMVLQNTECSDCGFRLTVTGYKKVKIELNAEAYQETFTVSASDPVVKLKAMKRDRAFRKANKPYRKFLSNYTLYAEQISEQKREAEGFAFRPKISVIIPVYEPNLDYFKQMITSVMNQSYENWEICVACGTRGNIQLGQLLRKYKAEEARFDFRMLDANEGISGNTNRALEIATGDVVVFADQDDLLYRDAFFQIVKMMNEDPDADILYSDEDKISMDSKTCYEPHFKPDFSPDLLQATNYISHLTAIRKTLLDEVGLLNPLYDGAQDYDLLLRCTEKAKKVSHISKILYHWRNHPGSTAGGGDSKSYAGDAGLRALQAHLDRTHAEADAVPMGEAGYYQLNYRWNPEVKPMLSVIISNADKGRGVSETWEKAGKLGYEPMEVLLYTPMTGISNKPKGDYILFLNANAEFENADWLRQLFGALQRPDVAAAGGLISYSDGRIASGAMAYRKGEVFDCFRGAVTATPEYANRNRIQQNVSILGLDCMLVKRSCFDEVDGLKKGAVERTQAMDLGLKLRQKGYRLVLLPSVNLKVPTLLENDTAKGEEPAGTAINAVDLGVMKAWEEVLNRPDPYFSPLLKQTRKGSWMLDESDK